MEDGAEDDIMIIEPTEAKSSSRKRPLSASQISEEPKPKQAKGSNAATTNNNGVSVD